MQKLIANGVSSCGGGTFDSVSLTGVITVNSSITAKEMEIEGVSTVRGQIDCDEIRVSGTIKVHGTVKSEDFSLYGMGNISGDLTGDNIEINGSLSVVGAVNGEKINIKMVNGCSAREVCGGSITIRKGKSANILQMLTSKRDFSAESIECDNVDIEYARVEKVCGSMVKIGPGCSIGTLEYSEDYYIDNSSKVETIVKRGTK